MPAVKCPTCRADVTWENNPHRPFCSERCRLIDLGAWVQEKYRIPGQKIDSARKGDDGDDEDQHDC